jgi:hypothetical protein
VTNKGGHILMNHHELIKRRNHCIFKMHEAVAQYHHWHNSFGQYESMLFNPNLQVNPYTQINPHFEVNPVTQVNPYLNVSPYTQVNPKLEVSPQTQVNPSVQVNPNTKAYFNFDPDFNLSIGNQWG